MKLKVYLLVFNHETTLNIDIIEQLKKLSSIQKIDSIFFNTYIIESFEFSGNLSFDIENAFNENLEFIVCEIKPNFDGNLRLSNMIHLNSVAI